MTQTDLNLPATMTLETLTEREAVVRSGLGSFFEVGRALAEIRDGAGYKLRGYKTFEAYCEKEFGATDRHARRLIEGAQTAVKVQAVLGDAPRNEGVARELAKVADDPVVLGKVAAGLEKKKTTLGKATAEVVAEVVARATGKSPKAKAAPKPAPTKSSGRGVQAPPPVDAPAPPLTEVSDICPHCRVTPDAYTRDAAGWHCGGCGGLVVLSVIAATGAQCPACAAPVQANEAFCANCGEPLPEGGAQ